MALSKGDDDYCLVCLGCCLDVVASTLKEELWLNTSLCFKDRLRKFIVIVPLWFLNLLNMEQNQLLSNVLMLRHNTF